MVAVQAVRREVEGHFDLMCVFGGCCEVGWLDVFIRCWHVKEGTLNRACVLVW